MKNKTPKVSSRDLTRYAKDYSALEFEQIQEDFRRAELVETIGKISSGRIVEVGCGRRSVVTELTNFESATIIEPIKKLLNDNLEMLNNSVKIEGFNGLLSEFLAKSEKKFDLCVLSSLLHEVNDQVEMLDNCWNLLEVNGVLVVNVPNAFSIHRILGVYLGKLDSVYSLTETQLTMQQINVPFTPQTLGELLEKNRFQIEKSFTVIPKFLDHKSLSEIIGSGLIDTEFLRNLNRLSKKLDGFGSEIIGIARKIG